MDITEFGKMLLVLCGGLITLAEAGKVIYNMAKPGLSLKKRVEVLEDHDKRDYISTHTPLAGRDSYIL